MNKILFLILIFINSLYALEVVELTSDYVLDSFFSIFFYLTVIMAPIFGALNLLKH